MHLVCSPQKKNGFVAFNDPNFAPKSRRNANLLLERQDTVTTDMCLTTKARQRVMEQPGKIYRETPSPENERMTMEKQDNHFKMYPLAFFKDNFPASHVSFLGGI